MVNLHIKIRETRSNFQQLSVLILFFHHSWCTIAAWNRKPLGPAGWRWPVIAWRSSRMYVFGFGWSISCQVVYFGGVSNFYGWIAWYLLLDKVRSYKGWGWRLILGVRFIPGLNYIASPVLRASFWHMTSSSTFIVC